MDIQFKTKLLWNCELVAQYGKLVQETSQFLFAIPESRLPSTKNEIELALEWLSKTILTADGRTNIKNAAPDLADRFLADNALNTLAVGYYMLSKFINDADAKICYEYQLYAFPPSNLSSNHDQPPKREMPAQLREKWQAIHEAILTDGRRRNKYFDDYITSINGEKSNGEQGG